ncbi:MAG: hypothetical protein IKP60_09925 [Treponema sp.]|nr:hypothetical protein [Treponema sp.]
MKKIFLAFVFAFVSFAFADDVVLLRDFVIDGAKVQKKVRVVSKQEFDYDGKIIRDYSPGDSDFIYFYNADGKIEKTYYTYNYKSKKGVWWYEYNIEKNLTEIKTADYNVIEYFYDDDTKLLVKKNDSGFCDEKYEYDQNGRMIKSLDQWGESEYEYNDTGNLVWMRNGQGDESFYRYDSKNRLVYDLLITFDDNNVILERITEFDDDNFTETMHTNRLGDGNVSYTSAEFYKYNQEGLMVYSRNETESFSPSEFLLGLRESESRNRTVEYFYKYDDYGNLMQTTKLIDGVETNFFYEYSFWDNGNVNTGIVYEEVK